MSNQYSVNMLKAKMISGGSANETGNLFGTALASEFFSPGSPACRMIRRDSSEDRIAIGNETPKCFMLESSTDLDESRGSGKGDIRDKTMGRFRALQGTLHTLDGDLKEQVQQKIRNLEEEVKRLNQEIEMSWSMHRSNRSTIHQLDPIAKFLIYCEKIVNKI